MLKLLGTLGAVTAAAVLYQRHFADRRTQLEMTAEEELRKVLLYAAPPTFLASVSVVEEAGMELRWLTKAAGN